MKRITVAVFLAVGALLSWPMSAQQRALGPQSLGGGAQAAPYFPERFDWQHKRPDEVGMIVTEWDEPLQVDMAHSVSKTFLTTMVGLAWQRGLIRNISDYARDYMPPGVDLFEAEHNQKISLGPRQIRLVKP